MVSVAVFSNVGEAVWVWVAVSVGGGGGVTVSIGGNSNGTSVIVDLEAGALQADSKKSKAPRIKYKR